MRWEYKVIKFNKRSFFSGTIDPEAFEAELNNLGRDGWELLPERKPLPSTREIPAIVCSVLDKPAVAIAFGAALPARAVAQSLPPGCDHSRLISQTAR